MKKNLLISLLYTIVTTVLLGLGYPLVVTAIAHVAFPKQAAGSLIYNAQGDLIGSHWIGQAFTGPTYFHSRPSAAGSGNGYDPTSSSGSNYAPTNAALITRVQQGVTAEQTADLTTADVPTDLVTASASGLDPDITPAAAYYQVARIAAQRGMSVDQVRALVQAHVQPRQFGLLGEPRVNVLELNLALDQTAPKK
ncbi:MAG TPA: potassium-transporting ATPase subunit KdpC [Acidobacteriaceae bacterium]|nr:potassium-transporting ATPase subunit KdpC [Acidobacteriaceae bacterium]